MHTTFTIETKGPGLYDLTRQVLHWVARVGMDEAILILFLRHTSASLVLQENADAEVKTDLTAFYDRLVPPGTDPSMVFLQHTYEGPDDMPSHIKATLLPTSLTIPVIDGRMALGTWQGIFLFEHRYRPHRREVAALMR